MRLARVDNATRRVEIAAGKIEKIADEMEDRWKDINIKKSYAQSASVALRCRQRSLTAHRDLTLYLDLS